MPCRSDFMEPTGKEKATNRVAKLLLYVLSALDPRWNSSPILEMAAENSYPNTDLLDEYTETLCTAVKNMTVEQKDRIMYDGRFPQARDLADWWDEHQKVDRKREEQERRDEYDINSLVGFIKSEYALAKKQNRAVNRVNIRNWMSANFK